MKKRDFYSNKWMKGFDWLGEIVKAGRGSMIGHVKKSCKSLNAKNRKVVSRRVNGPRAARAIRGVAVAA